MWIIGGSGYNDVWSSTDGITWTKVLANDSNPPSTQFSQRTYHTSLVFDNKMWVIGGNLGDMVSSLANDVWHLTASTPTCTLSSSSVMSGESPVISWTTQNATSGSINNGVGSVTPIDSGSIEAPPISSDTTYTMIVDNGVGDTAQCSAVAMAMKCKAGLVPCGRRCDVLSTTSYDESEPCTLCHLILMLQLIIEFIVKLSAIVAVFAIALSGLLYIFSAGNQGRIESAKTGIKYALIGFIIILIAWILVDSLFVMLGYIDPLSGEWYVVNY